METDSASAAFQRRLSGFLPRTVWPLLGASEPSVSREGCVLFADVAGFTPLTEGLARIGKEGAEELTRILNDFFAAMISIVHEEGGDVLRFGGDAMTLFLPTGGMGGLRAALRLQREAERFASIKTRGGTFPLAMKVGVSKGTVLYGLVGSEAVGWDYYNAGNALDLSAEAEHHCDKGQIALCPDCTRVVRAEGLPIEPCEDDFGLISDPRAFPFAGEAGATRSEEPPLPDTDLLLGFLPDFIHQKARMKEGLSVAEHRRTTTLFLMFKGLDYVHDPEVGLKVASVYREVAATVRRYGGSVNKIDMGDKGSKIIALFGTPLALENQEEMGCRASMEILRNDVLRTTLEDLRIGLTSAPLFAAYVGSDERREYTVMGDGINLSARLMANAFSWKMLCSKEVCDEASGALSFRTLDPIYVKGKKDKVPIYRPEGDRRGAGDRVTAFVGRERILGEYLPRLTERASPLLLAVTGEAGVGKSALMRELARGMSRMGYRHVSIPLASYGSHAYLGAWKGVLLSSLGVDLRAEEDLIAEALRNSADEGDIAYLPLLNDVLGLNQPESDVTRALEAKDRKDVTFAMMTRLILRQAEEEPYAIFLDQLEFADPASLEMLEVLAGEAENTRLKVILGYRTSAAETISAHAAPFEYLTVEPLGRSETKAYLTRIAGFAPPSETLLEFLEGKTHGNPKFLEQVLSAMKKEGLAAPGPSGLIEADEDRLASAVFPDTLQGLLLSRVDGLSEADRYLLKAASVLGVSFSLDLLSSLLNDSLEHVQERIRHLSTTGLVRPDSWKDRSYASFGDTLLCEALYESMNYGTKRVMHECVAGNLEKQGEKSPGLWPVLAGHYESAGCVPEAMRYLWLSAEDARGRYDTSSAFDYLNRYLVLGGEMAEGERPEGRMRSALLHLGKISKDLGRMEEGEAFCRRLLETTPHLCSEKVDALMQIAGNERQRGRLDRSLKLYGEAWEMAKDLEDQELQCRISLDSAVPHAMQGKIDVAMKRFKEAENLARKISAHQSLVYALMNQGVGLYYSREPEKALQVFRKARRIARIHTLKPNLAHLTVNMAQTLSDLGEYRKALDAVQEGMEISRQFGYRNHYIQALSNRAIYLTMLGRWDEGLESANTALTQARYHSMTYFTALNLHARGLILGVSGRFSDAAASQEEALKSHLEGHTRGEALACLSEILGLGNTLRYDGIAAPILRKYLPKLRGEAAQEGHSWTVGFQTHVSVFRWRRGEIGEAETRERLEALLEQALAQDGLWLVADVGRIAIEFQRETGNPERAAQICDDLFPRLIRHRCPPYVDPFLVAAAECYFSAGRDADLKRALRGLKRDEKALDRGLPAIHYHEFLSRVYRAEHAFTSARRRRRRALRILYEISTGMKKPALRRAFFGLPVVRRTLRGDEHG